MGEIDQKNIQGIVFTGFPELPFAVFVLGQITDRERAAAWLRQLLQSRAITDGRRGRTRTVAVNVAFSYAGLEAWGLPGDALATFPREFSEGMAGSEARSRILGDTGPSAPEAWVWGRRGAPAQPGGLRPESDVHLLLMLYATSAADVASLLAAQRTAYEGALREVFVRDTRTRDDQTEHFGFVDGLSQPRIEGSEATHREGVTFIKAGEFILGHTNEYDERPLSPTVASGAIADDLLPKATSDGGPADRRDLGASGSYLAVRQLEQDVAGFWTAMYEKSGEDGVRASHAEATRLAAKCVGRWPSGAPLAAAPDHDEPARRRDNRFQYRNDPLGLKCPLGAHIRRANPRDSLEPSPDESARLVRRHMILRRGRSYGEPLAPFRTETVKRERGLFFVAVNSNVRRQFEFIQQTWLNNPKFNGLHEGTDPLTGGREGDDAGNFSLPESPVRRRLTGLPAFVTTRGGEYFFLPGLPALEYLSRVGALP